MDNVRKNWPILQKFLQKYLENLENLEKTTSVSCFFEKLAKKGQILKTFCDYNTQNRFSNFLLKYLENIENFEENQLPFFKEK